MHPDNGLCDAAVIVVMGTKFSLNQTDCIVQVIILCNII